MFVVHYMSDASTPLPEMMIYFIKILKVNSLSNYPSIKNKLILKRDTKGAVISLSLQMRLG